MPTDIAHHPLNTIAPYFTMFPPAFPLSVLGAASGLVLDPFCGRGTTLFAARVLGLPSVGVDSSPVATAIAAAKLVDVSPEAVVELASRLLAEVVPGEVPDGAFWTLAYHPKTLQDICAIREGLELLFDDDTAVALRAIMLGALHGPRGKHVQSYLSNQMPRTYATKPAGAVRYWQRKNLLPEYVSLLDVVGRRAKRAYHEAPPRVSGSVFCADARSVQLPAEIGPVSSVVTSPPYFGMRTYVTDQWLRRWFLGGPSEPDYAMDKQLDMSSPEAFAGDLSKVWRSVASVAADGCTMTIRFGAIPSAPSSPERILRDSLDAAECGWTVKGAVDAGLPTKGRRQAEQFGFVRSKPIEEVDVNVVLRG